MSVFVSDPFNRANTTLASSGTRDTADIGGQWTLTQYNGTTFSIVSNKAKLTGSDASTENNTRVSSGLADCTISCDVTLASGCNGGFTFRHDGGATTNAIFNLYQIQDSSGTIQVYMYKVTAGNTYAQVGSTTNVPRAAVGHTVNLKLVLKGSSWKGYVNDVLLMDVTESNGSTNTQHGLRSGADLTMLYDNFFIWDREPLHPVSRAGRVLSS